MPEEFGPERHYPIRNQPVFSPVFSFQPGLAGSAAARAALAEATEADLEPAITRALMTSGVTVRHAGAYSPTRDELEG